MATIHVRMIQAIEALDNLIRSMPRRRSIDIQYRCDSVRDPVAEATSGGWACYKPGKRYLSVEAGTPIKKGEIAKYHRRVIYKALKDMRDQIPSLPVFAFSANAYVDGKPMSLHDPKLPKIAAGRTFTVEMTIDYQN